MTEREMATSLPMTTGASPETVGMRATRWIPVLMINTVIEQRLLHALLSPILPTKKNFMPEFGM
jgi:hypothetical protein